MVNPHAASSGTWNCTSQCEKPLAGLAVCADDTVIPEEYPIKIGLSGHVARSAVPS